MNAYFVTIPQEERENILNKHKEVYNGYRTLNPAPVENNQPLYTQDFANDKGGIVVNNKGVVKAYTNVGINEARKRKPYLATEEEEELDEFYTYDISDEGIEKEKQKRQKRQDDLDSALSVFDKLEDDELEDDEENENLSESEKVCEQCGMKESLCECGTGYMEEAECNECWNEEEELDEQEEELTVDVIGDSIMSSGRLEEVLEEYSPRHFMDEFEFVDEVIQQLIYPYEDEPFYDELYDYIKNEYGEKLFNIFQDENDDYLWGDDEDEWDEEDEYVTEQVNLISSELDTPMAKSAYSYMSGGPDQYTGDGEDYEEGYEDDIQKIQNMFDYASQHDSDPDTKEMMRKLDKTMNDDFDGSEPSDDEWKAFDFVSGGPPGVTFHEGEEEDNEEELDEKWSEKYKRSIDCNNPKGFSQRAHCQGKKKHAKEEKDVEEELDEDLRENFSKQRNLTLEMFQRFNKYN